jgi:hypothetical protein
MEGTKAKDAKRSIISIDHFIRNDTSDSHGEKVEL